MLILKRQTKVQAESVLASVSVLPCLVDLEKKQEANINVARGIYPAAEGSLLLLEFDPTTLKQSAQ